MRIAIVSDIHGNLTAFSAVLADLRRTSPDLVFHGGDVTHGGAGAAEIVDRIRDLAWPGVVGNTDEMLFRPEALEEFAKQSSAPPALWDAIREVAAADREALGDQRLAWMRSLPPAQFQGPMALVHASPQSCWRSPAPEAAAAELESAYAPLGRPIAVYAHIHRPFVRSLAALTVINTGSVSLSYDGDRRAAYLLLDEARPSIRRVEYDVEREVKALAVSRLPHADWFARILATARPQVP